MEHKAEARTFELDNIQSVQLQRVRFSRLCANQFLDLLFRGETVLANWIDLEASSTKIYNSLPSSVKPAYYQLVHYPLIVSANIGKLVSPFFLRLMTVLTLALVHLRWPKPTSGVSS